MVDQELEGAVVAIEQVVQFEPGVLRVIAPLRIANPLAVGQRRKPVVGLVESVFGGFTPHPANFDGR